MVQFSVLVIRIRTVKNERDFKRDVPRKITQKEKISQFDFKFDFKRDVPRKITQKERISQTD